ncbi:peptidylprolyl isomerase, partial [Escherichia coli]|nr:peptidylprolyl isomerase [Escherichia coli]
MMNKLLIAALLALPGTALAQTAPAPAPAPAQAAPAAAA